MLRYIKTGMMLLSIAYIVIGMMLLVMPQTSLLWICYAFGAVVLITGIVCLVQYARIRGTGFTAPFMLVGGVITAGLGIFTLAKPQVVASFLPIVFGIFIVVDGLSRIGTAMGGRQETFNGLSGIGDLIVTCASVHSRNRRAGYLMGQGRTMREAMNEVKMVVEGVYSAKAAVALARKYNIEIPIIEQVNKVLFEDKSPKEAVTELMLRDKKIENSQLPWE